MYVIANAIIKKERGMFVMSNFPEILIEDSKKKVSEIDKIMSKVEEISSERGKKHSELILLNLVMQPKCFLLQWEF